MTDGHAYYRIANYALRGHRTAKAPSMLAIRSSIKRYQYLEDVTSRGMPIFYESERDYLGAIPDTATHKIGHLPDGVRYVKCDGQIEKGDPGCTEHKYNDTICEGRPKKASWHPGT